jgi:hypothetical protein
VLRIKPLWRLGCCALLFCGYGEGGREALGTSMSGTGHSDAQSPELNSANRIAPLSPRWYGCELPRRSIASGCHPRSDTESWAHRKLFIIRQEEEHSET